MVGSSVWWESREVGREEGGGEETGDEGRTGRRGQDTGERGQGVDLREEDGTGTEEEETEKGRGEEGWRESGGLDGMATSS